MEYGERVLIPDSFPWHFSFLEMRRYGHRSTDDIVAAVLFRLFELSLAKQTISLDQMCVSCVPRGIIEGIQGEMTQSSPRKAVITQQIKAVQVALEGKYQYSGFELVQRLCAAGGFLAYMFDTRHGMRERDKPIIDFAYSDSGAVFILYGTFALASFVDLPCGHFDIKYKYYRRIRESVGNQAATLSELRSLSLLSDCCSQPMSVDLVKSLFSANSSSQSIATRSNVCYVCGKLLEQISFLCISHKVCCQCALKAYCTDMWMYTPCCQQQLDTASIIALHEAALTLCHLTAEVAKLKHAARVEDARIAYYQEVPEARGGSERRIVMPCESDKTGGAHTRYDETDFLPSKPAQIQPHKRDKARYELWKCSTCDQPYKDEEAKFQCPNACQCENCATEAALQGSDTVCPVCGFPFQKETRDRMLAVKRRCHVCGIAVKHASILTELPCTVCYRCLEIVSYSSLVTVRCSLCKDAPRAIQREKIGQLRQQQFSVACCLLANKESLRAQRFKCGHFVCKTHQHTLRRCKTCAEMEYGDRVLIPENWPWRASFLEMRRFGVAEDPVPAFIFRLFELRSAQQIESVSQLLPGVPHDIIKALRSSLSAPSPKKAAITNSINTIRGLVESHYHRSGRDLLSALCRAGNVKLSLFNERVDVKESETSLVDLAWTADGTLFILYGSVALSSFIDLPCEHFDLKYVYFQQARRAIANEAVNFERLLSVPLHCAFCNSDVSVCIAKSLFRPVPEKAKRDPRPGECCICRGKVNQSRSICPDHVACYLCGIKAYFTDSWRNTPCCRQPFPEFFLFDLHEIARSICHLTDAFARLKHSKAMERSIASREGRHTPSLTTQNLRQHTPTNSAQGNVASQRRECSTCGKEYSKKDAHCQCPNACQCKSCSIEAALRQTVPYCPVCRMAYGEATVQHMRKLKKLCHVCEITLTKRSSSTTFGCCMGCTDVKEMQKSEIDKLLRGHFEAACCKKAHKPLLTAGTFLCGHQICKVHKDTLRFCRKCRRELIRRK